MAFLIPTLSHMIPVLTAQSDVAEAMWLAAQKDNEVNATSPRGGTCRWGFSFDRSETLKRHDPFRTAG